MNVGKSIKIALAMKSMKAQDLAERMGRSNSTISVMCGRDTCRGQELQELARIFEMKVSEFVKLGED